MKQCIKCSTIIPSFIINSIGKRVNVTGRKYCFACKPYGKGRSIKESFDTDRITKYATCIRCYKPFSYLRIKKKGFSELFCKRCRSKQNVTKAWAVELLGGCCQVCGYHKCFQALCFHHKDPTSKEFTFSKCRHLPRKALMSELNKCILLCKNCHDEFHAGRFCFIYSPLLEGFVK